MKSELYDIFIETTEEYYKDLALFYKYEAAKCKANESAVYYNLANESIGETLTNIKNGIVKFIENAFEWLKKTFKKIWDKILRLLGIRKKAHPYNRSSDNSNNSSSSNNTSGSSNSGSSSSSSDNKSGTHTEDGKSTIILNEQGIISVISSKIRDIATRLRTLEETIPEISFKDISIDSIVKKVNTIPNDPDFLRKQVEKITKAFNSDIEKLRNDMLNAKAIIRSNPELASHFRKGLMYLIKALDTYFNVSLPKVVLAIAPIADGADEAKVNEVYEKIKNIISEM